MKDLSRMSRDVQIAWNKAVSTKKLEDIEEYNRLEDEYNIQLGINRSISYNNHKRNSNYNDNISY